jgi:hypothetical protein
MERERSHVMTFRTNSHAIKPQLLGGILVALFVSKGSGSAKWVLTNTTTTQWKLRQDLREEVVDAESEEREEHDPHARAVEQEEEEVFQIVVPHAWLSG